MNKRGLFGVNLFLIVVVFLVGLFFGAYVVVNLSSSGASGGFLESVVGFIVDGFSSDLQKEVLVEASGPLAVIKYDKLAFGGEDFGNSVIDSDGNVNSFSYFDSSGDVVAGGGFDVRDSGVGSGSSGAGSSGPGSGGGGSSRVVWSVESGSEILEVQSAVPVGVKSVNGIAEVRAVLADGGVRTINVLPGEAIEKAHVEKVESVELREIERDGTDKIRYFIDAKKTGRLFGIFSVEYDFVAEVDAESGKVVGKGPWWGGFVFGGGSSEDDGSVGSGGGSGNGSSSNDSENGILCSMEAKLCPDGSSVGRDPLNGCEFRTCGGSENVEESCEDDYNLDDVSVKDICLAQDGEWKLFRDTCVASCSFLKNPEGAICGDALTCGCDCGEGRCWDSEYNICRDSLFYGVDKCPEGYSAKTSFNGAEVKIIDCKKLPDDLGQECLTNEDCEFNCVVTNEALVELGCDEFSCGSEQEIICEGIKGACGAYGDGDYGKDIAVEGFVRQTVCLE